MAVPGHVPARRAHARGRRRSGVHAVVLGTRVVPMTRILEGYWSWRWIDKTAGRFGQYRQGKRRAAEPGPAPMGYLCEYLAFAPAELGPQRVRPAPARHELQIPVHQRLAQPVTDQARPRGKRTRHGKLLISAPSQPVTAEYGSDTDHPCIKSYARMRAGVRARRWPPGSGRHACRDRAQSPARLGVTDRGCPTVLWRGDTRPVPGNPGRLPAAGAPPTAQRAR